MDKSNKIPTLLAIGAIVYVLFGAQIKEKFSNFDISKFIPSGGVVSSEVFPDKPTDSSILAASEEVKIQLTKATPEEKLILARLWREMAKLIVADNTPITTADIRAANGRIGKVANLNIKGKYPGLGVSLSETTKKVLGDDPTQIDRNKAAALFNGYSWAARQ